MRRPDPNHTDAASIVPTHDTAVVAGADVSGERLHLDDDVWINGHRRPRTEFPDFVALGARPHLLVRTLGRLPTARPRCPFCKTRTHSTEATHDDPLAESPDDLPQFYALTRLDHCRRCGFWQINELRTETYDARALLYDRHVLMTAASVQRVFDDAPEESLEEIASWFRRHPDLYHSVSPTYLEKLVSRIYRAEGRYAEVTHVGRPADEGVDVLLVEEDQSSSLVQVKRREKPRAAEPVGTIRNLLGTLVLKGSRCGVVVSTADHFTYAAREAAATAASVGFTIELVDRQALDRLLARSLPEAPWTDVAAQLALERDKWLTTPQA